MDFYVTLATDPGPNSNVFWSNQLFSIKGYTGLQSSTLNNADGVGKQFLFSLWDAVQATPGTLPGSHCTVSATATDGSAGAQCRYLYDWQAGHSYRFRLTAMGNSWFKVNVTDVSPGVVNGDSFDIGSIQTDASKFPLLVNSIPNVSGSDVVQWVEYFDWNNHRTSCLSVAYTSATFSMTAVDASNGQTLSFPPSSVSSNSAPCQAKNAAIQGTNSTQTAGIGQTAQGLFKAASGSCMTAQDGLTDGSPAGSNKAVLAACPTAASVRAAGGRSARNALWVWSADGSIQLQNGYCLTVKDAAAQIGAAVVLESCIPGAVNQQWSQIGANASGQAGSIASAQSGLCLSSASSGVNASGQPVLTLGACSGSSSGWTVPGSSFAY
jgi:hypothetical protein